MSSTSGGIARYISTASFALRRARAVARTAGDRLQSIRARERVAERRSIASMSRTERRALWIDQV